MHNSQRMMDYSGRHPPSFGGQCALQCETVKTTAKDLWDSLNKVYEDKSLVNNIYLRINNIHLRVNNIYLRGQLYNPKKKNGVLVHDYLNEFNALLTSLLGIRVEIDEKEQITILLCLISDSCDNLIMRLNHVTKVDMDL